MNRYLTLIFLVTTTTLAPLKSNSTSINIAKGPIIKTFLLINKKSRNNHIYCSATLFKNRGTCSLITNAHCVSGSDENILLGMPPKVNRTNSKNIRLLFPLNNSQNSYIFAPTASKNISKEKDLVELKIPTLFKRKFCHTLLDQNYIDSIENLKNWEYENLHSEKQSFLATVGYVGAIPQIYQSKRVPYFGSGIYPISRSLTSPIIPYKISPTFSMLKIGRLPVYPGMSGGGLISKDKLLGIISNTIPLQETTFAIPFHQVIHFINGQKISGAKDLSMFTNKYTTTSNIISINKFKMVAMNENRGTGDNLPAVGIDIDKLLYKKNLIKLDVGKIITTSFLDDRYFQDSFGPFRMAKEGIVNPLNHQEILMGVKGENFEQIDGIDDYLNRDLGNDLITRKNTQLFLGLEYRKKIIKRMDSIYNDYLGDRPPGLIGGELLVLTKDALHPFGWRTIKRAEVTMTINIDYANNKITAIPTGRYIYNINYTIPYFACLSSSKFDFTISYSSDYKMIYLVSNKYPAEKLTCKNSNLLKLICKSPRMEIGLSLSSTDTKIMRYRFVYYNDDKTITYLFGKVKGSSSD